jgi:flavin-dependent dehydrogenase
MKKSPVLVIGGGVAGASCASRLREHGVEVVVAEKAAFPRAKVCGCSLGGAGLASLEQLSLRQWALDTGVPTRLWRASLGGKRIELPLPGGVVISRQALDTKLLSTAGEAGASISMPCRATIDSADEHSVLATLQFGQQQQQREFAAIVVASGLNASGLQQILPWRELPNGPFGVSFSASSESIEPGVIYMACDDDGYVGLALLEDGRVDIAAALAPGAAAACKRSPIQRIEAILAASEFGAWKFDDRSPVMTTPPLRRTRLAGAGRVLAIGDAAGYVEPFTGEGMTWAMQSGMAAANLIATSLDGLSTVGQSWDHQLNALLRRKKLTCRAVTAALRWPLARRAVAQTLSHWPSLATPLIRSLNHG